jgi:hypothetical protein
VDSILERMIFDGERLSDLMAPLDLGWKARTSAELALMEDLRPSSPNAPRAATSQDSAHMSSKTKTTDHGRKRQGLRWCRSCGFRSFGTRARLGT